MTLRRTENLGAYRIDDIVVDTVRREVKRGGKTLKLGKLSYRLLVLLAEEAPRVVDRGEIIDRIWAGRFVTADTVKQRIVLLRKALGDDARAPRYISVVRGQGYKLIARVQPLAIGSLEENGWRPQRAATIAIGSAFAAIIAVAWLLSLWFAEPRDEAPRSIAVMAFADLSEDGGRQWFADGLSNDIGTRLQDIPDLRVAAWTSTQSLAAKQFTAGEIGTILDVSHVLDGAIRFVGEKFRVDVQLNEASTDTQLWADRYEGAMTDILTVQEEIAVDVADQLRVMLSGSSQSLDQTTPDVWARFQRAAYINRNLLGESFDEARSLLEQAIERDPNYFPAYRQLIFTYRNLPNVGLLGWSEANQRADEIFEQALAKWGDRPELISDRAWEAWAARGDFQAAARDYERLLRSKSNALHVGIVPFLVALNRHDEAIALGERVVTEDPICALCYANLANAYLAAGEYDKTEQVYLTASTLRLESSRNLGTQYAMALLLRGDAEAALDQFEVLSARYETPYVASVMGSAMALHDLGRGEEFKLAFDELQRLVGNRGHLARATVYSYIGNLDAAFNVMADAESLPAQAFDSAPLDRLRHHVRWPEVAEKAGLLPRDERQDIALALL